MKSFVLSILGFLIAILVNAFVPQVAQGVNLKSYDYFGFLNGKSFYPSYENLLSLWFKDDGIKNKEKHLNEYLSQTSLKWYLDLLRKKKEIQNGSRSI